MGKPRRGRPKGSLSKSVTERDKRILQAWREGKYLSVPDCAAQEGLDPSYANKLLKGKLKRKASYLDSRREKILKKLRDIPMTLWWDLAHQMGRVESSIDSLEDELGQILEKNSRLEQRVKGK